MLNSMSPKPRWRTSDAPRPWILLLAGATFAAAMLACCAHAPSPVMVVDDPSELPGIEAKYARPLGAVRIGMPYEDLKTLFPEAHPVGEKDDAEAYEIVDVQKYVTRSDVHERNIDYYFGNPPPRIRRQVLWFYFYQGRLVHWGNPGNWPPHPERILEEHGGRQ